MSGDPGYPAGAQFDSAAPFNRPDAPRLPYAIRVVYRDGVERCLCPDRTVSDCTRNAQRFATVAEAEDELAAFTAMKPRYDFIANVVDLDDPEHAPDVDDDLLEGSPFCECGEQATEDEEASNTCSACGKVLS